MPYLTADPVNFVVDKRSDVLLVPNSALAFQPRSQDEESSADSGNSPGASPKSDAEKGEKTAEKTADGKASNGEKKGSRRARAQITSGTLWVKDKDDDQLHSIKVETGASDGTLTEVSGPNISEGLEVVVAEIREDHSSGETKNPFAPQIFRGGGRGGRGGGGGGGGGRGRGG